MERKIENEIKANFWGAVFFINIQNLTLKIIKTKTIEMRENQFYSLRVKHNTAPKQFSFVTNFP